MKRTVHIFAFLFLLSVCAFGQTGFDNVYNQLKLKNYFRAREIYSDKKNHYSSQERKIIEAFLNNAFNKTEESNIIIERLLQKKVSLSDSLALKLYRIKEDNSVKLFEYKEAKNSLEIIIANYSALLSKDEIEEITNNLKIWSALENEPKQEVHINKSNRLKMKIDKAGLKNLEIHTEEDSIDFIFDTGANISTVPEKTAKLLGMKIIPAFIEVGTITGQKVNAQLAVCPKIYLGTIEIKNAVFLVFNDTTLSFPQIDYHINGIIGYPIIEALHEIQITQDGYFSVPIEETLINSPSNMALNELIPLICIDGRHFTFDTGADATILYSSFYSENQKEITEKYKPTKFSFGGAAGKKEFDGYSITWDLCILDKNLKMDSIRLVKDKIKRDETVYGNIGQDIIKQFEKMTLNFNKMFIKFE